MIRYPLILLAATIRLNVRAAEPLSPIQKDVLTHLDLMQTDLVTINQAT